MRTLKTVGIGLFALIILTALIAAAPPPTRFANIFVTHNAEIGGDLTVDDDLSVADDTAVAGDLSVTGDATVGTIAVTGAGSVGDDLTLTTQLIRGGATITATDALTITAGYDAYNLDSAGAVTITLAACTEFEELFIAGDDNNTITVADTNIRSSDGNAITVGQYDTLHMLCIDSEWLEVSKTANQ